MLSLRRPDARVLARLTGELGDLVPHPARGGKVRFDEETIGWGTKRYERARMSLRRLEQFHVGDTATIPPGVASPGLRTMVVTRRLGVWTVGPVEVTEYAESDGGVVCEFRTLHGHLLQGIERFELQRLPNGIVRLGIHAAASPAVWWVWPVLPLLRYLQRRFRLATIDHIRRATGREVLPPPTPSP